MGLEFSFVLPLGPAQQRPTRPARSRSANRNPPMKINMLMHFYACAEPFAPEHSRTSPAYVRFVKELLRDGLIERPSKRLREQFPGWAYRTTPKGDVLVHAICTVPTPIERKRWTIPS